MNTCIYSISSHIHRSFIQEEISDEKLDSKITVYLPVLWRTPSAIVQKLATWLRLVTNFSLDVTKFKLISLMNF